MVAQPTLTTPGGLLLRPWQEADAPVFFSAYQDPSIRRWHARKRPSSQAEVLQWFETYRQGWTQGDAAHWAVTDSVGQVLGRIAVRGIDHSDRTGGCAYWVLPAARGAGVATAALNAVSDWAFQDADLYRLFLDHSTGNEASCRVATKAGFAYEGTMRSSAVHDDGRHDMHLHARLRDGII